MRLREVEGRIQWLLDLPRECKILGSWVILICFSRHITVAGLEVKQQEIKLLPILDEVTVEGGFTNYIVNLVYQLYFLLVKFALNYGFLGMPCNHKSRVICMFLHCLSRTGAEL